MERKKSAKKSLQCKFYLLPLQHTSLIGIDQVVCKFVATETKCRVNDFIFRAQIGAPPNYSWAKGANTPREKSPLKSWLLVTRCRPHAARHAEGDCEVMQNLRMRRHLAHRPFSCQSSTGKESGSQVEIPEVWTKISLLRAWEGLLFFRFLLLFSLTVLLKSLDLRIGWKWLNSHVGQMIWR